MLGGLLLIGLFIFLWKWGSAYNQEQERLGKWAEARADRLDQRDRNREEAEKELQTKRAVIEATYQGAEELIATAESPILREMELSRLKTCQMVGQPYELSYDQIVRQRLIETPLPSNVVSINRHR
jgi:hypothetical protein